MTDKKQENQEKHLKLLDFKKAKHEEEKPPEFILDKLKEVTEQTKNNKLRTIVLHYDYEGKDEETNEDVLLGSTVMWNHTLNGLELLGLVRVIESMAFGIAMGFDDD